MDYKRELQFQPMNLPSRLRLLWGFIRSLPGELVASRRALAYRYFLATTYPGTLFDPGCVVSAGCQFAEGVHVGARAAMANCQVGRYTSIGYDGRYTNCQIGAFCSFGPQVLAGLGRHPTEFVSTSPAFYSPNNSGCRISFVDRPLFEENLPIVIGSDVWLGARVIILDGVKIGDGAIIAAGAVVTKDVEPYAIVGGIPAKLIRMRFDAETISRLLFSRWWDRSLEWITRHAVDFTDVSHFITAVESPYYD